MLTNLWWFHVQICNDYIVLQKKKATSSENNQGKRQSRVRVLVKIWALQFFNLCIVWIVNEQNTHTQSLQQKSSLVNLINEKEIYLDKNHVKKGDHRTKHFPDSMNRGNAKDSLLFSCMWTMPSLMIITYHVPFLPLQTLIYRSYLFPNQGVFKFKVLLTMSVIVSSAWGGACLGTRPVPRV